MRCSLVLPSETLTTRNADTRVSDQGDLFPHAVQKTRFASSTTLLFAQWIRIVGKHPHAVLMTMLLITLAAVFQLGKLRIEIEPHALTVDGDPARDFYTQTVETFGSDNITIVFIKDKQLIESNKLAAIKATVEALEALPFIARTESLFSIPYLRTIDEFVHTEPYLHTIPRKPEERSRILKAASNNPFVQDILLSEDATAMAVNLYIADGDGRPGFNEEVTATIEHTLAPLKIQVDEIFQIGLPYIRTTITEHIRKDQATILPLAITALLLTLIVTLRHPHGVLVPLLTSGLSILWILGLMAALEIPINVLTAIVPVLLVIVGSTEDIHLITEYYKGLQSGLGRRDAVRYMARGMALAIVLTFVTTSIGVLVLEVNSIELLRHFGLVAFIALLLNFLITISLIPVYFRFLGNEKPPKGCLKWASLRTRLVENIYRFSISNKRWILLMTLGAVSAATYGATHIGINNNLSEYFADTSPVKQRARKLHEELSGTEAFSIVLTGPFEASFKKLEHLREIRKIQRFLERHPAFDSSVSVADHISLVNSVFNDSGNPELPDKNEVLEELSLFVKHGQISQFVSKDYRQASIVVRHGLSSSSELNRVLDELRAFLSTNIDPILQPQITGESILSNYAADHLALGQVKSLVLVLFAIFVIIALLFGKLKAGLLAILTNLFPIIMLFGVMGYAGIPLNAATAMIATITLGVCIDNSVHFMARYRCELRRYQGEAAAVKAAMLAEALPIMTSSVALAAGLGTLMASSFLPIVYFGALSAMVIVLAFYANFVVTPILLSFPKLAFCQSVSPQAQ